MKLPCHCPITAAVHQAERPLIEGEITKTYVGPAGAAGYNDAMARLLPGGAHRTIREYPYLNRDTLQVDFAAMLDPAG